MKTARSNRAVFDSPNDVPGLIRPVDLLATLVTFLRLDRESCDRSGVQALQSDRLPGFLAVSVGAFIEPLQRGIDLGNQLPLTVPSTQLDRPVRFG